jgi:ADP-ribose pyrophosphatase YjhB (NUDIX family)
MTKICDHTSVGMFVWKNNKLLLIERLKFPFCFAVPAGHTDGDKTFEEAAKRELEEEVGLKAISLEKIFEGRRENPCRRVDGTWHFWKMYKVETEGELKRSLDETKKAGWYDKKQIQKLAEKTEKYKLGKISDDEWQKNPGLEVVMLDFLKEFKII